MAELPPFEVMAKKVAEQALDEYIYKGKTLRKWIDIIIDFEKKSENECEKNQSKDDGSVTL